jgi:DNA-3-methyladenine glycosylase II
VKNYHRATAHLEKADPILARIIRQHGPCAIQLNRRYFYSLVEAILSQQLSIKAAATIFRRFRELLDGKIEPPAILNLRDEQFRGVGISRQKMGYLRDLAQKWSDDHIAVRRFAKMNDEEVIDALTQVKGIGRWTAEMFLIFCLGRLDVLPVGDLGFRNAVKRAYGLRRDPKPEKIAQMAEAWRPYRSIATWYFWESWDNKPIIRNSPKEG